MTLRRFRFAALAAALSGLLSAMPAAAATVIYSFEGYGKSTTSRYTRDYFSGDESMSDTTLDHIPFSATFTIDTARLGSAGGLTATWNGPPGLIAPGGRSFDQWFLPDERGLVFEFAYSSPVDPWAPIVVLDSVTSTARLRLLDNEPGPVPMFNIDGFELPDLSNFLIEFSSDTMAFTQTTDFDQLFVETGESSEIFSVGRASTRVIIPGVPEPGQWATLIIGFGMVGAAIRSRRATAPASQAA